MTGKIYSDVKQGKPLTAEQEAYANLIYTANLLLQRQTEILSALDLSPTQYNILRILRGAGPAGLRCGEIAERLLTRDPDVTRLLDRLQRKKFVKRSRDRRDRRIVTVRITSEGLDSLNRLDGPVEQMQADLLGHLGEKHLAQLTVLLERAREKVERNSEQTE